MLRISLFFIVIHCYRREPIEPKPCKIGLCAQVPLLISLLLTMAARCSIRLILRAARSAASRRMGGHRSGLMVRDAPCGAPHHEAREQPHQSFGSGNSSRYLLIARPRRRSAGSRGCARPVVERDGQHEIGQALVVELAAQLREGLLRDREVRASSRGRRAAPPWPAASSCRPACGLVARSRGCRRR